MVEQQLVWTACPQRRVDGGVVVSAVVSPRLLPPVDGKLEEFPDFVDWPATAGQVRWHVEVDSQVIPLGPEHVLTTPDSTLWTALFSPTTLVRRHQTLDLSRHLMLSSRPRTSGISWQGCTSRSRPSTRPITPPWTSCGPPTLPSSRTWSTTPTRPGGPAPD